MPLVMKEGKLIIVWENKLIWLEYYVCYGSSSTTKYYVNLLTYYLHHRHSSEQAGTRFFRVLTLWEAVMIIVWYFLQMRVPSRLSKMVQSRMLHSMLVIGLPSRYLLPMSTVSSLNSVLYLCKTFYEVDTNTILITLVQPKITYCLSTFQLHA